MKRCSGCISRQRMLNRAVKDMRQGNIRQALGRVAVVGTSATKQAARQMRSPLASRRGR